MREQCAQTPRYHHDCLWKFDTAIRAINNGAFEYLTKPFDLNQAVDVISRALKSVKVPAHEDQASSLRSKGEF
ncbi:MAG: hypothetical protein R3C11_11850 [Planctomycetaceae bacterium]